MVEILHHLKCMKPCKQRDMKRDIYHINWLYRRISEPSTSTVIIYKLRKYDNSTKTTLWP